MRVHPTYDETCEHLAKAAEKSPFIRKEVIGKSFEGRDLWLATATDFSIPDDQKQVLALSCGVHGSEEGGRALGMAVLDWAQTPAALNTLRRQKILLLPCVNPDGAERDSYHNAQDVNLYLAHAADGTPLTPEREAVWNVLSRETPEAYADCHGLAGGGMEELCLPPLGRKCGAENVILNVIAWDMTRAAEAAGFPQRLPHVLDCWISEDRGLPLDKLLLRRFNTLTFTVEMNECYLTWQQCQQSGLPRLLALMEYGNRASFGLPYEGYPCGWLGGATMTGIIPHGETPGARRRNRAQMMPFINSRVAQFGRRPDRDGVSAVDLEITAGEPATPEAMGLLVRVYPWCTVREVLFDGKPLERDAFPTGWRLVDDNCSHTCVVGLGFPVENGKHDVRVKYTEAQGH
jgi:hypothetical protein